MGERLLRGVAAARTLVEGPAAGPEGYIWWRIRTDDGRGGWVVEAVMADGGGALQTLIPLR